MTHEDGSFLFLDIKMLSTFLFFFNKYGDIPIIIFLQNYRFCILNLQFSKNYTNVQ